MSRKDFLQIRVKSAEQRSEAVHNFLFENGALGVVEHENEIISYFPGSLGEDDILLPLSTFLKSLDQIMDADNVIFSSYQQSLWFLS